MRLAPLFAVIVVDLVGFGIVMPILPFYAQRFGASATMLGLLLASYAAMQFLFAPVWGRWSDRIGRKRVLMVTIAGGAGGLVVLAFADSLAWIFAGRLLAGVCAANVSVATAYVTDVTDERSRAAGMGLIGAAFGIGFVLGPAIGGMAATYGYRVPILIAAGLNLLNILHVGWRLPEPVRHVAQATARMGAMLADRAVRAILWRNFLFIVGVAQLESVFAFLMMDRFGYDAHQVAYLLVFTALIMVLVQGGLVRRLTRVADTTLLGVGVVLLAVALAGVGIAPSLPLLLIALTASALGRGLAQPALMSLASKRAPPALRGAIMGVFQSAGSLARVVAPALAGLLYDWHPAAPFFLGAGLCALVAGRRKYWTPLKTVILAKAGIQKAFEIMRSPLSRG